MMNKYICIFIATLFLISVASIGVIAETTGKGSQNTEGKGQQLREKILERVEKVSAISQKRVESVLEKYPEASEMLSGVPSEKMKAFLLLSRERQKEILSTDAESALKTINELSLKKIDISLLAKRREIARDVLEKAKEKYTAAKIEYARINGVYNIRKDQFAQARRELAACKGNDTNETASKCAEMREKIIERSRDLITNAAQMALKHLEKLKEKISGAESLDEETAGQIMTELDKEIKEINGIITLLEGATTKDEIQSAATRLNSIWNSIKYRERLHATRLVHSEVWGMLKRSENLETRLEKALDNVSDDVNVTEINEKLDRFSSKVADAKKKIGQAEELFREAYSLRIDNNNETNKTKITELTQQAKDLSKQAIQDIKAAYDMLKDILKFLRANNVLIPSAKDVSGEEAYEPTEEHG
jgi:hypothetical protein